MLCEETQLRSGRKPLLGQKGRPSSGRFDKQGISVMKAIIIVTAGLVAMLRVAAAADLPRKEPPPVAAAPIGKYRIGKYPVGKYPVGKYPQPVVTKG